MEVNSVSHQISGDFDMPVELEFLDEQCERIRAKLCRVNSGFLRVHSPVEIPVGSKLAVVHDGIRTEVEVVYCETPALGLCHLGLAMTVVRGGTVRLDLRLPVDIRATLSVPGWHEPVRARIVDMSRNGLGMVLPKPVTAGMAAAVDFGHGVAFGEIRHCRPQSKRTYRAGFWLEEFLPRHARATKMHPAQEPKLDKGLFGFRLLDQMGKASAAIRALIRRST